jgi:ribose transport system permease protein
MSGVAGEGQLAPSGGGSVASAAPPGRKQTSNWWSKLVELQEYRLLIVVVLLLIVGGVLKGSTFLDKDNLLNVLTQGSINGVLAIGMTFVIATAGIDLSVGSGVAAACILGGKFSDSNTLLFMGGALLMGVLIGAINATAIAYGRVVPFIATLAMLAIARGAALSISDKTPISLFDMSTLRWFGTGKVLGIPAAVIVFLVVTGLGWLLLNRTAYGRYVVAVGGNTEAARIAGVRVRWIIFSVYVLSGLCVGIAAILLCGRLASASPVSGDQYELDAIAAVVIGGTSLAGGRATMFGTLLGVITFALIFNLLTLMNLAVEIQQITKGAIILAAVLIQRRGN